LVCEPQAFDRLNKFRADKERACLGIIDDIFELFLLERGLKGDAINPPFIAAP